MLFFMDLAPPPVANFAHFPHDPSAFDTVHFFDSSFDPSLGEEMPHQWNFGDGTTSTVLSASHRYATDGDYPVRLIVTTVDGRIGSMSKMIQVRTHDVAIFDFSVPDATRVGRTRSITVGVSNRRYPEWVEVRLLKSTPSGGFGVVGTATQLVPAFRRNRTVPFDFSYRFTDDDLLAGRVTFQAVATILGLRDAVPTDNAVIAPATRVRPPLP
jgi:PKD repeat protein